jgi:hypothetical protein
MQTASARPSLLVEILALLPTPVILFVTTSNSRYLANQADLGYEVSLLFPYLGMALLAMLLGFGLCLLRERRPAEFLLWCYYGIGPFYLAYRIFHKARWEIGRGAMSDTVEDVVFLLLMALMVAGVVIVYARRMPRVPICRFLAVIGPLFLAAEIYQFGSQAEFIDTRLSLADKLGLESRGAASSLEPHAPAAELPNVYHLILDGFQTEMFEHTFPLEERGERLSGFLYFPENVATYGRTRFSIPSTFLGNPYDNQSSQAAFVRSQFDSPQSILYSLREAGYQTFGLHVEPKVKDTDEHLFDHSVRHGEHVVIRASSNVQIFRKLWVVSNFPRLVYPLFVSAQEARDLLHQKVIPRDQQLKSYRAFVNYLEVEEELPASGRYTFLHLMIPHPPFTLDANCAPQEEGVSAEERYLAHIRCGDKIIRDFVDRLKKLGRYHDSLVLIHGDHGFYAKLEGETLLDLGANQEVDPDRVEGHTDDHARLRSRALLLLKPPDAGGSGYAFTTSPAESTLLDVAPTMMDALGIDADTTYSGFSLLHPDSIPQDRQRYYYFHDFVSIDGIYGLAAQISRWIIDEDRAIKDGVILLPQASADATVRKAPN